MRHLCLLFLALSLLCRVQAEDKPAAEAKPAPAAPAAPAAFPEPAKVVLDWLTAIKTGDQALLKTVFVEAVSAKLEKEGWPAVMKQYQEALAEQFGEYNLADFTFKYEGDAQAGVVQIIHKGEKFPGELAVVKEKGAWKAAQR